MIRTIVSYFPLEQKIKVLNPSGLDIIFTREEFEATLATGDEYTIILKKGEFTFSQKTYNKIKDRLWSIKPGE